MSYLRVIPRDLFNEADLLKCLGRLWILLDNSSNRRAVLGEDGEHDGSAFEIAQSNDGGSISVVNLPFTIGGRSFHLSRPLNARTPWPLYATDGEDEDVRVFDDAGNFSAAFAALISES